MFHFHAIFRFHQGEKLNPAEHYSWVQLFWFQDMAANHQDLPHQLSDHAVVKDQHVFSDDPGQHQVNYEEWQQTSQRDLEHRREFFVLFRLDRW